MKIYLLTGAAGFIGHSVAQHLLDAGHMVIGVDILNDAYDPHLKLWRLQQLQKNPFFIFYKKDITQYAVMQELFLELTQQKKYTITAIINLAARAGVRPSVDNPWIYIDTNLTGTQNLLEMARHHNISKFVLASSSSVYGDNTAMPFAEDSNTDHPLSPYAASKKAAEVLCYTYHTLHQIDVSVLRYFTVYGPAGRPDMSLFRFVQSLYEGKSIFLFGDGSQQRDFTYITDIAAGTVRSLKCKGYHIINLGSDQPVAINHILHLLQQYTGKNAKITSQPTHPADVPTTWANINKAKDLLQWVPRVTIEEGLHSLCQWYKQEHAWAHKIDLGY